jgi:acetyl-CoA carboxylase biotin carboxyl carrier protein
MSRENSDLQKIKELIEIMKENDLVEVEIKHDDDKIFLKRAQPQPPAVTAVPIVGSNIPLAPEAQRLGPEATASAAQEQEELVEIKASIVGTFYAAPSPDSDPFVGVDDHVDPQTVVCIIEAMKVMNEIKAETGGTIAEVLVTTGQAVEYGQVLFKVRPD